MDNLTHSVSGLDLNKERQADVDSQDNNHVIFHHIRTECQDTGIQPQEALNALARVLTYLENEPRVLSCLSKAEMDILRRIETRMRKQMENFKTVPTLLQPGSAK